MLIIYFKKKCSVYFCMFKGIVYLYFVHYGFFISTWHFLQGFARRRKFFAEPLLKDEGIASVILENPYCILFNTKCCFCSKHSPQILNVCQICTVSLEFVVKIIFTEYSRKDASMASVFKLSSCYQEVADLNLENARNI